ncbi:hypothetical protein IM40_00215 [Candidatus Paracaedimonas acanthamoebae]|nr:hypothetical protein IM40_00215 [Candidatus Paracaedimonas acanthamoebae]
MRFFFWVLSLGSLCLSGCSGIKPGTYPEQSDMKKGPGLFTGEQGEFEILSSQKLLNKESPESSQSIKNDPK